MSIIFKYISSHPLVTAIIFVATTATSVNAETCIAQPLAGAHVVNFGILNAGDPPKQEQGNIDIDCSGFSPLVTLLQIEVSISAGVSGNIVDRELQNTAGDALQYKLYTNVLQNTVFGDGTGDTETILTSCSPLGTGSCSPLIPITIFGELTLPAIIPAGEYKDDYIITMDINF